jgi:hypothetical protein
MGQYYKIVNLDKKEFLEPHDFNDGSKLMEFGLSGMGVMSGLAILLADGNGLGGGDLGSENPIIGSWKGDRIVVAGDYSEKMVKGTKENVYNYANQHFKNVSAETLAALLDDRYYKKKLKRNLKVVVLLQKTTKKH